MAILFDKLFLLMGCTLLMLFHTPAFDQLEVISFLCAVIFFCTMSCCNLERIPISQLPKNSQIFSVGLWSLFSLLILLFPPLGFFLPFLFYELVPFLPFQNKEYQGTAAKQIYSLFDSNDRLALAKKYAFLSVCLFPALVMQFYKNPQPLLLLALCALALFLSWKTRRLLNLEHAFRLLRDTTTEYHLLLKQKNQDLIQKQDYEIHVATLKERNRIAREIHDNVGHMLSRSLLQSGALIAVNQQENLKEPLEALKGTLSSAMDSIRQSVHDLHNDSVDLKGSILELLSDFYEYQLQLDYDISSSVPAPIKYCFISIVKEALSNISRHSNATAISITLREHPMLYQLIVSDNGTVNSPGKTSCGMGLANMAERIKQLNGNFSVTNEHGFRIFASIPI